MQNAFPSVIWNGHVHSYQSLVADNLLESHNFGVTILLAEWVTSGENVMQDVSTSWTLTLSLHHGGRGSFYHMHYF